MAEPKKGSCLCNTTVSLFPACEQGNAWLPKAFNNVPENFYSGHVWSDGKNIYYSDNGKHYVLNGDTWETKAWNGHTDFSGTRIWTDGTNIYYSNCVDDTHYVLNVDTWETKAWAGDAVDWLDGCDVWTDGTNIYYSINGAHGVLNGDTWERKNWNIDAFNAEDIWSDGETIYLNSNRNDGACYYLSGGKWLTKTWNVKDLGRYIWTNGTDIYLSSSAGHYVLNGDTWETKAWKGYTDFYGSGLWSDGVNIYYSTSSLFGATVEHYVLTYEQTTIENASFLQGWLIGRRLAGMRKLPDAPPVDPPEGTKARIVDDVLVVTGRGTATIIDGVLYVK